MDEIIFFIPNKNDAEKRLMGAVERLVPTLSMKICRNSYSLRRRLLPGGNSPSAVVILAATKQDLLSVMPLRELLLSFRIIMVLPDSDDVTLAMGWGMWPRFVSYADGDFRDVAGVLNKIVGTTPRQAKGALKRWTSVRCKP
ncbi:MAG: hypothetical protein ABSC55_07560 [Syntrophorhabdales bacterium]